MRVLVRGAVGNSVTLSLAARGIRHEDGRQGWQTLFEGRVPSGIFLSEGLKVPV